MPGKSRSRLCRRRQVHGLRGQHRGRQRPRAHRGLQGRRWRPQHPTGRRSHGRPRPGPGPSQRGRHACRAPGNHLHGRLLLVQSAENLRVPADNGKLGKITVVAFDEDPITLGAVKDGSLRARSSSSHSSGLTRAASCSPPTSAVTSRLFRPTALILSRARLSARTMSICSRPISRLS